ncbi:hypothetical protein GCM10007147_27900 [Nocardiopsis kunsanensis]|uniref:Uncharacterized protein n=1 Tax=Nocardiopsis kunsanensis TaxID=141693 RepID=A0A918XEW2_9ACTN|nr:hypothetical protein GCM10007147_27900 [Nocardiopsis kunsanensis]
MARALKRKQSRALLSSARLLALVLGCPIGPTSWVVVVPQTGGCFSAWARRRSVGRVLWRRARE